jgi:hypothetical protein
VARFAARDVPGLKLEMDRELDRFHQPNRPLGVFHAPTADLPDAAAFPWCIAFDETLGVLVTSDGTNWV